MFWGYHLHGYRNETRMHRISQTITAVSKNNIKQCGWRYQYSKINTKSYENQVTGYHGSFLHQPVTSKALSAVIRQQWHIELLKNCIVLHTRIRSSTTRPCSIATWTRPCTGLLRLSPTSSNVVSATISHHNRCFKYANAHVRTNSI